MSTAQLSIRVRFALPPQGACDAAAILAAVSKPNDTMANAVTLGMQKLAFRAQKERFTGKGPFPVSEHRLGNVSGRLKRDIHADTAEKTGTGYRGKIGSAVEYFGAHEVGFAGTVQVPAHTRDAREVNRPKKDRTSKSGKVVSIRANQFSLLPQSVRAHSRKMTIPARGPLRAAITEHAEAIIGPEITKAVKAAAKKKS